MSKAVHDSLRQKVSAFWQEAVGERAARLEALVPASAQEVAAALRNDWADQVSEDIAFHVTDWAWDAAFLMAVLLEPQRFTRTEINDGVGLMLVHAPNHLAAAAKLYGFPVQDVFEVGALDGAPAT